MFRFTLTSRGYAIESKKDVKKRLGKSPDTAEAYIYAKIDTLKNRTREELMITNLSTDYDPLDGY